MSLSVPKRPVSFAILARTASDSPDSRRWRFTGLILRPLRDELICKVAGGTADAGEGLDLSLIAQLLGDKQTGLAIQAEVPPFITACSGRPVRRKSRNCGCLRSRTAIDMAANTPIEFLLEDSGIELLTLYVYCPGPSLPVPLTDHDIAIVIAYDSEECRDALRIIDRAATRWPRPILNLPRLVGNLDRDKLHGLLKGIEGLDIPATRIREQGSIIRCGSVEALVCGHCGRAAVSDHRPGRVGSHAGVGPRQAR